MSNGQSNKKIRGIILVVVGLGLAYWGYQMSGSMSSQFNEAVAGSPSDGVMLRYILGAASAVAGAFVLVKK